MLVLQVLDIANTSLSQLPDLRLTELKEFNASLNQLTFVAADTLSNLSDVRVLDLSYNRLNSPPSNAWHTMLHLNILKLAGNPFTSVSNDSFMGLDRLEWLDIADINGTMEVLLKYSNNSSKLILPSYVLFFSHYDTSEQ